tara:strand:- start:1719 stop:1931 length:213 start_codon:yes stop_codon:yes gene_type:complete
MPTYYWNYNSDSISLLTYVKKVCDNIDNICESLRECDGDMYLSDLRTLYKMNYKLHNLVSQIKKEEKEND